MERHSSCRGCRSTSGMRAMCRLDSGTTGSDRWEERRAPREPLRCRTTLMRALTRKSEPLPDQLRMPDQRMRKDATDGPLIRRDVVRRPCHLLKDASSTPLTPA